MAVKHQIGAGGRIYMASAAAPETVDSTNTYDKTMFVRGITINQAIGNDNVTTMDADDDNFAERFIQALTNASGSLRALFGAPAGTFLLYADGVKNANNHTDGRGKVDVIYDPFGSVAGNLRLSFTLLFTSLPLTGELGTAVGGDFGIQVDGGVTLGAVPA